jgi:hypothetical protein
MKIAIGALAGLVVAGLAWTQPAAAQGWPSGSYYQTAPAQPGPPAYGERRHVEPGYGGEMRERCIGLRREAENLRIRMDREWNPLERARTEGHLRQVQDQEARAGCRR